jgi:hypothetical protein
LSSASSNSNDTVGYWRWRTRPYKGVAQYSLAERHAMNGMLHRVYPELSIRRLSALFGVSRTWCSTHPSPEELAECDVALRDAIERLV